MKKLLVLALFLTSTFTITACDMNSSISQVATYSISVDFGEAHEGQTLTLKDGDLLDLEELSLINPKYECLSWTDGVKTYKPDEVIIVKDNMSLKGDFALKSLFYVLSDEKDGYLLKSFTDNDADEVVIPNTYNGLPVKGMLDSAFSESNKIKKLTISDSVEKIVGGALSNLKMLEELITPFYGETINDNESTFGFLFGMSGNMQDMSVPETLKKVTLTKQKNITENAFVNLNNIEEVVLKNATVINSYAFSNMNKLQKVTLNEGLKSLQANSFSSLSRLESLQLPYSLEIFNNPLTSTGVKSLHFSKNLKEYNFRNESFKLESITVNEDNELFASKDGALYNKNFTKIITYPCNKVEESYTLLDTIKEIGDSAFKYSKFKSIDLKKVEIIGDEAFRYSAIQNVTFPSTIKSLGKTSFSASKIEKINFPEKLDNVTSLLVGDYIFSSCEQLTEIVIPSYIDNISNFFVSSDTVKSIKFLGSVKSIGDCAFAGTKISSIDITFKDNATIGDRIFINCGNLKTWNIHFEENITNYPKFTGNGLGDYVPNIICDNNEIATILKEKWSAYKSFIGTGVSKSLVIEDGVLLKFNGTSEETDVVIPEGVTRINREAFAKNIFIEKVTLPSTLVAVEQNVFYGCDNLKILEFTNDNPSAEIKCYYKDINGITEKQFSSYSWVDNNAIILVKDTVVKENLIKNISFTFTNSVFSKDELVINDDMIISKDGATLIRGYVKEEGGFVIPKTVKTIWNECFSGQSNLTSIDLTGVETVKDNAFDYCGLTDLVVPESLVNIGYCAFSYMDNLKTIKIESAAIIDSSGFGDNNYVESIDLGTKIVSIGSCAFSNVGTKTDGIEYIIVPASVIDIAEDAFCDFNCSTINCCFSEEYATNTFEYRTDFVSNTDANVVFDFVN